MSDTPKRSGSLTIARRIVACAFLLAWVVVAWVSYQTPYLQACSDQIVRVGNAPLIRSCDPLSLLDAPMLVLLVTGIVLLLPDLSPYLSAIEIPGLFRLERKVAEQERKQDEILRMIQEIRLEVKQNIDFKPNIYVTTNHAAEQGARTQRLSDGLPNKQELFTLEEKQLAREQPDAADAT